MVELLDTLEVKNAYLQSVQRVTEHAICSLLYKPEADQKD